VLHEKPRHEAAVCSALEWRSMTMLMVGIGHMWVRVSEPTVPM